MIKREGVPMSVQKSKTTKRKAAPRWGLFAFKIDAYTPDTIPMARLAEYMAELAEVMGEKASVHFSGLKRGSTILNARVQREADPKVTERVSAVRRGDGPRDALRAYRTINKMLRDDNAAGFLARANGGGTLLRFPGREEAQEQFAAIREAGSIDGILTRIGGADDTVHITVDDGVGNRVANIQANRAVAKKLAAKLFEPVRLNGKGRWARDADGNWGLISFTVESFESLDDAPLGVALENLRKVDVAWDETTLDELRLIRSGPPAKRPNGRH